MSSYRSAEITVDEIRLQGAGEMNDVGVACYWVWKEHALATKCSLDGSAPSVHPSGRSPALKPEHIAVLHDIVKERAQASLQEIADELHHRCGMRVCDVSGEFC